MVEPPDLKQDAFEQTEEEAEQFNDEVLSQNDQEMLS